METQQPAQQRYGDIVHEYLLARGKGQGACEFLWAV